MPRQIAFYNEKTGKFDWYDKDELKRAHEPKSRVYLHTDRMAPTRHPQTGQVFDSKSAFRQCTKNHGGIELGNDMPPPPKPKELSVEERKADIAKVLSGYGI